MMIHDDDSNTVVLFRSNLDTSRYYYATTLGPPKPKMPKRKSQEAAECGLPVLAMLKEPGVLTNLLSFSRHSAWPGRKQDLGIGSVQLARMRP